MLQTVQKRIKELNMIAPGDKVLVGVSGGADSVALLLALVSMQKDMDFTLEVIHVEHGIRGEESLQDAAFVEDLCKRCQVVCHSVTVDVPAYCQESGLGTEEAARLLRYQEFARLAEAMKAKVALAHHMEDNAETILFQMARGSALTGLCGMQPMRQDENGVLYIRPLLGVHRKEIEEFLQGHGMGYRVDSTNDQLDYSRNYIRKVVLPELERVNGQAVEHIHGAAGQLSEIKDFLSMEVVKAWEETAELVNGVKLNLPVLLDLHRVLQKELVYKAIAEVSGGKKDITSTHVEDVLSLCSNQSGRIAMLPNGVIGKREFDVLYITKEDIAKATQGGAETETAVCALVVSESDLQDILCSGGAKEIPFGKQGEKLILSFRENTSNPDEIPKKTYTKWFDYDKIKAGFCIRTRKSGDYLINDALGHRKKLKQYFIDEKISSSDRNEMWLITQDNLVLWAVGGRISEHVKVTESTKTIIEITYDGGN